MKLKEYIYLPFSKSPFFNILINKIKLHRIPVASYDAGRFGSISQINFDTIFNDNQYEEEWFLAKDTIYSFPGKSGGVNAGDRRAIYYLIKYLQPKAVLEIGTHIGASTSAIACALKSLKPLEVGLIRNFVTVDIEDVNDPVSKPWQKFGSDYSPKEIMAQIECNELVSFVTESSVDYLLKCEHHYDLIFLDGDHSSDAVYQEISAASKLLNQGGFILLHDYFPNLQPLWSNGELKPGPWLAIKRLKKEGMTISIKPLGKLPWPTKMNSTVTSLALLGKAQ